MWCIWDQEVIDMELTRKKIMEIGNRNPIVHDVLLKWRRGDFTFEKAMMVAVFVLDEKYQKQMEEMEGIIKDYGKSKAISSAIVPKPEKIPGRPVRKKDKVQLGDKEQR